VGLRPTRIASPSLQVLQARGQRAVLHLDAEELQMFLVVRAGDAVGTQQRAVPDFEADHREVAVAKRKPLSRVVVKLNRVSFQ
jgi:hypothetical protein